MTEVGIIWRGVFFSPGQTVTGRVIVLDEARRPFRRVHWSVRRNSGPVLATGSTEVIEIPEAQEGVYDLTAQVEDSAGVIVTGFSRTWVLEENASRSTLRLPPYQGSLVLLGRLYSNTRATEAVSGFQPPRLLQTQSEDIFLLPGTTHVTFDLDPNLDQVDDEVVVRTKYGNVPLRGLPHGLTDEKVGYQYLPAGEAFPAPADLRLRLNLDLFKVHGTSAQASQYRVRVHCWQLMPGIFQYTRCPHTAHPGGQAYRQRKFAILFTHLDVEQDVVGTSPVPVQTFEAQEVTSLPDMSLRADGQWTVPDPQGGTSYAEANRFTIYESEQGELDAWGLAAIENARPFLLSLHRPGVPPQQQRIKRIFGKAVLYVQGTLIEGTEVTLTVVKGATTQSLTVPITATVASTVDRLFVRAGEVALDISDFQFGGTGVQVYVSVNALGAVESPASVRDEAIPAVAQEHIYSTAFSPYVIFDGACYSSPQIVAQVDLESGVSVAPISGCHHSDCGPVGLYCYTDEPTISVVATDDSASEAGGTGTFTFYRSGAVTDELTVDFAVTGTATSGVDYVAIGTSVTFAIGQSTATKTVTVLDDADVEDPETVVVTLQTGTGYVLGSPSAATVTILSDDLPVVTVEATDDSATEGGDTGTFTFTRTGPTTAGLTTFFTLSGTADEGLDYENLGTSVTFSPGQATATKTVVAINDIEVEDPETVILTLAAGAGYTVGSPSQATVTITSEDLPIITVSATTPVATETGDDGVFTFTRTGPTTASLEVTFAVTGSATSGVDYTSLGTTVTFGIGQATATKLVEVIDDPDEEPVETVIVTLSAGAGYVVGSPGAATVNIVSEDIDTPDQVVVVYNTGSYIPEDGSFGAAFVFYRTGDTTSALTVDFTVGGTAIQGTDYSADPAPLGPSVIIPAGENSVQVLVTATEDAEFEPTESITVTLQASINYLLGDLTEATIYISDNDAESSLTVTLAGGYDVDSHPDDPIVDIGVYYLDAYDCEGAGATYPFGISSDGNPNLDALTDAHSQAMLGAAYTQGSSVVLPALGYDRFSSPIWRLENAGGSFYNVAGDSENGWPDCASPIWSNSLTWYVVVYGWVGASYPDIVCGRYDIANRSATNTLLVPGTPGTPYTATIRVRGVVSLSTYTGGSRSGNFQTGGVVSDITQEKVTLTLSGDSTVYYLNASSSETKYNVAMDYTVEIPVVGGATLTVEIDNQDGFQRRKGFNNATVTVPGFAATDDLWIHLDLTLT